MVRFNSVRPSSWAGAATYQLFRGNIASSSCADHFKAAVHYPGFRAHEGQRIMKKILAAIALGGGLDLMVRILHDDQRRIRRACARRRVHAPSQHDAARRHHYRREYVRPRDAPGPQVDNAKEPIALMKQKGSSMNWASSGP